MTLEITSPMPVSTTLSPDALGPPGTAGQFAILDVYEGDVRDDRARLNDGMDREFKVSGLLQKSALHDIDINLSMNAEEGHSYLVAYKDAVTSFITGPDGRITILHNPDREFSKLEITCVAKSGEAALAQFHKLTGPILDHLSCWRALKTDHLCSLKIDQGWMPRAVALGMLGL